MSKPKRPAAPLVLLSMLLLGIFPLPADHQSAFAQNPAGRSQAGVGALKLMEATAERAGLKEADVGSSSEDEVLHIIGQIINIILGFVGILFFGLLFLSGFRWMTSAGNEETVAQSKATIRTAVIGITVIFSAFILTNFILNQLGSITSAPQESTCWAATAEADCRFDKAAMVASDEDSEATCSSVAVRQGCAAEFYIWSAPSSE